MNRKILSLILISVLMGLFVGGCVKAATPVPTAAPTNTPSPAPTIQPGDSKRTLSVDDLERSYFLHVPPGLAADKPLPLVMAFAGGHMEGENEGTYMAMTTDFNDLADAHGFLVVYPIAQGDYQGVYPGFVSWNFSGCCGYTGQDNLDEEAYLRGILSDLGAMARIDSKRIYAAGFSNGGDFVYQLGCEMSDLFAAIAPVAGFLVTNPCQPKQPVSVVHVHGLNDNYTGDTAKIMMNGVLTDTVEQSVEKGIAAWAQLDGCNSTAKVEKKGNVTHTVYSTCRAGTAVELYAIEGFGHTWPSPYALPAISTQMIWDFFAAHSKQ
jgi:polyhydroxybutyrate depolymerase